jgi:hypothetical protein
MTIEEKITIKKEEISNLINSIPGDITILPSIQRKLKVLENELSNLYEQLQTKEKAERYRDIIENYLTVEVAEKSNKVTHLEKAYNFVNTYFAVELGLRIKNTSIVRFNSVLANNPDCHIKILKNLFQNPVYTLTVLQNPVFNLLFLENSVLVEKWVTENIIKTVIFPQWVYKVLMSYGVMVNALLQSEVIPLEVVKIYAEEFPDEVKRIDFRLKLEKMQKINSTNL